MRIVLAVTDDGEGQAAGDWGEPYRPCPAAIAAVAVGIRRVRGPHKQVSLLQGWHFGPTPSRSSRPSAIHVHPSIQSQ